MYRVQIFVNMQLSIEIEGDNFVHSMKKARSFIRRKLETSIKVANRIDTLAGQGVTAIHFTKPEDLVPEDIEGLNPEEVHDLLEEVLGPDDATDAQSTE